MNAAPELRTARLVLRPFTLDDLEPVFALSREAGMRRWLPDQVYPDLDAGREVLTRLIGAYRDAGAPVSAPLVLGVEVRASGVLVGHVGLGPYRGLVEIGYAVGEAHQGQGLATEAVVAFSGWGRQVRGLPGIWGIVDRENRASRRVLEKAGYVLDHEDGDRCWYRQGPGGAG